MFLSLSSFHGDSREDWVQTEAGFVQMTPVLENSNDREYMYYHVVNKG